MFQTPDRSVLTPFDANHSPMSQNWHPNWMSSPMNAMAMAMAMNPMGMNAMRTVMHSMGMNGMDQTGFGGSPDRGGMQFHGAHMGGQGMTPPDRSAFSSGSSNGKLLVHRLI